MRYLAKLILFLSGWKIDKQMPEGADRSVLCHAPHTSNWDFVIGRLAMYYYRMPVKILIKKEAFKGPVGPLLKLMGGIPVDRTKNNNLTDFAAKLFKEHERLSIFFTPEGTRSHNAEWKKGFYFIAKKAEVPIFLTYMDFEKKRGGFLGKFEPTGDMESDIREIKSRYVGVKGKVPENGVLAEDL